MPIPVEMVSQVQRVPIGALAVLGKLRTLEEVLRWACVQRPEAQLVDVVIQDEYTHDVVLRWPREGTDFFLVFDTT